MLEGPSAKALGLRISKEYLMIERGSAKFSMGRMYLTKEVCGRDNKCWHLQMKRDEVLASLGPKPHQHIQSRKQERLKTDFKKTKRDN